MERLGRKREEGLYESEVKILKLHGANDEMNREGKRKERGEERKGKGRGTPEAEAEKRRGARDGERQRGQNIDMQTARTASSSSACLPLCY